MSDLRHVSSCAATMLRFQQTEGRQLCSYICGGNSLTAASHELIKLRRRAFTVESQNCRLCKFETIITWIDTEQANFLVCSVESWPGLKMVNSVPIFYLRCSCVMSDALCWMLSPYSWHQSQALSGRPAVWFDDNTNCLICKICI